MPRLEVIRDGEPSPSRMQRFLGWATRGRWSGPLTSNSPELAKFFGYSPSASGISVNEVTALNFSAWWQGVRVLSDAVSSIALMTYRTLDNGGRERYKAHPVYSLLRYHPNPEMTAMLARQTVQAHALTNGNGYMEIVRDRMDRPRELWPLTPDRVYPFRDSVGMLRYRVVNPSGADSTFDPAEIIHIRGLSHDGVTGYSVVAKARESIGLGLAAEKFGATFFGNGTRFGGVISNKGHKPDDRVLKNFREKVESEHQGVERAHKFLLLWNDASFTQLGVPPEDAQFLETRQFQVTEIARWFNLPPHKLNDLTRSTYSNIEQQEISFYVTSLRPWLVCWEEELMAKLLTPAEREQVYIEHLPEALLRGDSAGRAALYKGLFDVGAITPNEIRARENLGNPLPAGDVAYVPSGVTALGGQKGGEQ